MKSYDQWKTASPYDEEEYSKVKFKKLDYDVYKKNKDLWEVQDGN